MFWTEKYSIIQPHLFLAWSIKTVCESEKKNFVTSHLSVTNCIHTCLPGPANARKQRNSMESVEYAVSICLREQLTTDQTVPWEVVLRKVLLLPIPSC